MARLLKTTAQHHDARKIVHYGDKLHVFRQSRQLALHALHNATIDQYGDDPIPRTTCTRSCVRLWTKSTS